MANKKNEIIINTKNVKVQFNTSTPAFREVMGSYYVAILEMADMQKIYAKNVKILSESVTKLTEKLEKGTLTDRERTRLELDSEGLVAYTDKYQAYRTEIRERVEKAYTEIISEGLYNAYKEYVLLQKKDEFKKALVDFLGKYNVQATDSLVDFLLSVMGTRTAHANTKVSSRGKTLLLAKTEKNFNELFLHSLAQLMVDKNCLKPELYSFVYKAEAVTHIDSKIDSIEPVETESKDVTNALSVLVEVHNALNDDINDENIVDAPSEEIVESENPFSDYTVTQLKAELKALGLKVSGSKSELLDRLTDALLA